MSTQKQIGWSVNTKLLSEICKKLDRLIKVTGAGIPASTTTTTTTV